VARNAAVGLRFLRLRSGTPDVELNGIYRQYENEPEGSRRRAEENLVHRSSPAATQTEDKSLKSLMVPARAQKGCAKQHFTALQ
jgi:hypothetical protein